MAHTGHIPFQSNPEANHLAVTKTLQQLWEAIDRIQKNPTFRGILDMQGGRIVNVGRSRSGGDVPNREELEANALLINAQGQHVAHSDLICKGNVRSRVRARQAYDLVPLAQLNEILGVALNGFVSTQTLTLVNGDNNNVSLGVTPTTFYEITGPTATFNISGLVAARTGRLIALVNPTGFPMTILDQSALSTTANRIKTNKGWDMQTQTDGVVILAYLSSGWRVISAVL